MNAARMAACAVLLGSWVGAARAAGPVDGPRQAQPARSSIIELRQIDVNNIAMFVSNTGSFAWDKGTGNAGLEFPKGTHKTAVFAAGLWLGAEVGGAVRVAVAEYSDEYGPGTILPSGAPDDPNKAEYKVYKLNRTYATAAERDAALADYEAGAEIHGAPDVSVQADGSLNILGDQMLWAVYNDADPANHTNRAGSTSPLGIEVQQTTFAFNRVGALGNTIFLRYIFINKGTNTLENMFVSQWSDPDLGGFTDDLVGCDVPRSLGFCYNATNADGQYGANPPAVGYDFFKGPVVGGTPLPMSSFNKYINGTDPNTAQKTYNYMKGLDPDGNPVINPVTGQVTTFFVSGDPVTGSGWLDSSPDDRRLMLSAGPFTMAPGDTQEVVAAIVLAQSTSQENARLKSITLLRCADDEAQTAFDLDFQIPSPPSSPIVTVTPQDGAVQLSWDSSALNYDQDPYEFEGFVVYQGASVAGPFIPVATFDVQNGIGIVLDNDCDEDLGIILPRVRVRGKDEGLQFQTRLTQDAVRGGPLHSATPYYFAVTAYSVGLGQAPQVLESPQNVLVVVPQTPPAEVSHASAAVSSPVYGQRDAALAPARDSVVIAVIHPDSLRAARYHIGYKPDASGTPTWHLVRTIGTAVDTVLNHMTNFACDFDFPVVDGLQVRNCGLILRTLSDVRYENVGPNPQAIIGMNIGLPFFGGGSDYSAHLFGSSLDPAVTTDALRFKNLEIRFTGGPAGQKAYRYQRAAGQYLLQDYVDVPWTVWDVDNNVQLNAGFLENAPTANGMWDPGTDPATLGNREIIWPMLSTYSDTPLPFYQDPVRDDALNEASELDFQYALWPLAVAAVPGDPPDYPIDPGDKIVFELGLISVAGQASIESANDSIAFVVTPANRFDVAQGRSEMARIKVVPNPYFTHSAYELTLFNRQVKFTHLPSRCTVRIFSLRGDLLRTLEKNDNSSQLTWDLETARGLPVASGIYIFHVDAPGLGTHVGKMAIFMEKERLNNF
jgi:hypothetical protein